MMARSWHDEYGWETLRVNEMAQTERRIGTAAAGLLMLMVAMSVVPAHWLDWSGSMRLAGRSYSNQLSAIASVAAVVFALRLAYAGFEHTQFHRVTTVAIAGALLVVSTDSLRILAEQAVARELWSPGRVFSGDAARALPLCLLAFVALTHITILVTSIAAITVSVTPRRWFRPERSQRFSVVAGRIGQRMVDASVGLVVIHVLGAYVITEPMFAALGQTVPSVGGVADGSSLKTVFYAAWLHLQNLGVVEYVAGLWAAVTLAQLVASTTPRIGAKVLTATRHAGRMLAPALMGFTLLVGAIAVGWSDIRLPHMHGIVAAFREGRATADIAHWLGAAGTVFGIPRQGVTNTLVVVISALVAGAGLMTCTFACHVMTDDPSLVSRIDRRTRVLIPESSLNLVLPIAVPAVVLVTPLLPALRNLFVGAPTSLVRFVSDRHDPIRFYATLHTVPTSGAVTPGNLLTGTFVGIAVVSALGIVFESARAFCIGLSATCIALAIIATSGTQLDLLMAYGAGFLLVTPLVVMYDESNRHNPVLRARMTVGVCIAVGLMLAYRIAPDAPPAVLVLGTVLLQYGLFAGSLNRAAHVTPRAIRASYSLPLLVGAVALAAHQPNHWVRAGAYNSVAQAVALPFVTLPLTLVLVLRLTSNEAKQLTPV